MWIINQQIKYIEGKEVDKEANTFDLHRCINIYITIGISIL